MSSTARSFPSMHLVRAEETARREEGQPFRVAVIAPPWLPVPPVGYGGTESVIDTLCRGLAGLGHDVLLAATGDSTCPVALTSWFEHGQGIESAAAVAELAHAASGYEAAHRWGADIVHDHTVAGPAVGALGAPVPVVTTCHGPFAGVLAPIYRALSYHVPVIAISRAQATAAADTQIAAVIHHGVDLDAFALGDSSGEYVLFLGRMSPDKGIHVAIDVAESAGVPLLIGAKMRERDEHDYFDAVIRPRLRSGVDYLGEVGADERRDLLGRALCLLNPIQWNEPFGLVAVEAMASGTPVVATPNGAMPEIVVDGRTGFLRSTRDDLADAVVRCASLDRSECRRHVAEEFSMEFMASNHARFYGMVVDAHQRGRAR